MVPFHAFGQALARRLKDAVMEERLSMGDIYYFCNWPTKWLFHDPGHRDASPVDEVLARIDPKTTSIVVFSDAGAARGGLSPRRVEATRQFYLQARRQAARFCWLNPMPESRWAGTSAGQIAQFLPMLELISPSGMEVMTRLLQCGRIGSHAALLLEKTP
jgi:uncharacterized protein with von Willebrand factor type A (vWA) domain